MMEKNPLGFWLKRDNQLAFLNDLSKKLSIRYPSDWGKITAKEFVENGGGSILKHFGGSTSKLLRTVYSEIKWKDEWFGNNKLPKYFWQIAENRKKTLHQLSTEFQIKKPSDWGKITYKRIAERGYASLVILYDGSVMKTLKEVFPGMKDNIIVV